MSYYAKAIIDFRRYSDSLLVTIASFIITSLTNNEYFPNLSPSLDDMQQYLDAYKQALTDAHGKDRRKIAIKNLTKADLQQQLNNLGVCINQLSKGHATMVASSGFPTNKIRERLHMQVLENFTLKHGMNAGTIVSQTDAVKGATGYMHQVTPDPVTPYSVWVSAITSRCKHTHKDLQPGTKYWVK